MAYSSITVFVEIAASAVAVSIVCTSDGKTSAVVSAELAVKIPVRKMAHKIMPSNTPFKMGSSFVVKWMCCLRLSA